MACLERGLWKYNFAIVVTELVDKVTIGCKLSIKDLECASTQSVQVSHQRELSHVHKLGKCLHRLRFFILRRILSVESVDSTPAFFALNKEPGVILRVLENGKRAKGDRICMRMG